MMDWQIDTGYNVPPEIAQQYGGLSLFDWEREMKRWERPENDSRQRHSVENQNKHTILDNVSLVENQNKHTILDNVSLVENQNKHTILDSETENKIKPNIWIERYAPKGSARGEKRYYRLCWRENKRMKQRHIPGGNDKSFFSNYRKGLLEEMIREGLSIESILSRWEEILF